MKTEGFSFHGKGNIVPRKEFDESKFTLKPDQIDKDCRLYIGNSTFIAISTLSLKQ
jgi:hypothetical protein